MLYPTELRVLICGCERVFSALFRKSDSAILSIAFLTLAKNHPEIHHSQSHIIMVMGTRFSPSFVQVRLDNTGSIAFAAPAQNRAKMHHPQPHMQYIKIYITYYLFAFKSDSAIPSIAFLTLAKNHPKIHHSQSHIIMVMGTCLQPHMQYIKIYITSSACFSCLGAGFAALLNKFRVLTVLKPFLV